MKKKTVPARSNGKHPGGRPPKFDPVYCEQVKSLMREGKSITAFASAIEVSRETIYDWAREFPEFSDALRKARAHRTTWWEDKLATLASTGTGSAAAIIFALKNVASEDWRDRQEITQTTEIRHTLDLTNMADGDLAALADLLDVAQDNRALPHAVN